MIPQSGLNCHMGPEDSTTFCIKLQNLLWPLQLFTLISLILGLKSYPRDQKDIAATSSRDLFSHPSLPSPQNFIETTKQWHEHFHCKPKLLCISTGGKKIPGMQGVVLEPLLGAGEKCCRTLLTSSTWSVSHKGLLHLDIAALYKPWVTVLMLVPVQRVWVLQTAFLFFITDAERNRQRCWEVDGSNLIFFLTCGPFLGLSLWARRE